MYKKIWYQTNVKEECIEINEKEGQNEVTDH